MKGGKILNKVLADIQKLGIVPVVKIDRVEDALPLAKALCEGGLPCAEITFRTEAAEEAIRVMATEYPEMLIGAGTVLTTEQVDKAMEAGAKFIVSPGLNPKVVKYCVEKGYPITPGTANPSDVETAIELGLEVVKFFPAEAAGGLNMIKSMAAPYVNMKFMPTGGINEVNVKDYLKEKVIACCGGSWMLSKELIKNKQFDTILKLCQNAKEIVKELSIKLGSSIIGKIFTVYYYINQWYQPSNYMYTEERRDYYTDSSYSKFLYTSTYYFYGIPPY